MVKAYCGEENAERTFDELNGRLRSSGFRAQCLSGLMMPIMSFIGNLGYVAVCVVGGLLILNGEIGFGVIVAFMMYVRYFTQPLSQIAQAMQSLQSAAAAGERVFEFLEADHMKIIRTFSYLEKRSDYLFYLSIPTLIVRNENSHR